MPESEQTMFMRSNGISAEGTRDQYADGKAAKVWEIFIGDKKSRTKNYCDFLVNLLRNRGCRRILDVACGTGVDSIMLVEEGFEVVSCDASDKMLKYALKERWERRKDSKFDNWVIEEANWLTLYDDMREYLQGGFDAVICLGNSFAHMLDNDGDQNQQKQAIRNFERCLKPGGLLLIDHRNYDTICNGGSAPSKSIYYNSQHMTDIKTSVLYVGGKPNIVTLDYLISTDEGISEFRLSYYPHQLEVFKKILKEIFGYGCYHEIFGDFKEINSNDTPAFYIHVIEKSK
ncbi:hypothetical protein PVAND_009454 [Polypedilum vanderplanki]|uniref:Glycine N-methyltransferase n=1 Tax=Polypedilum vanderplanki TaxID=319348 RepID=A0A9J6CE55_POLVA|nr:hypothetical protein PVAND_009454 [Polypedilum vanderplanki]